MSKKNSSAKRSWLGRLFFGGSKGLADDIEAKRAAKNDVEEIVSPVKQIVRGFMERKLAVGALCVVIAMFLLVFIGPLFMTTYTDTYTEVTQANLPPTMSMLSVPSELKNDIKMIDSYGSFSVGLSNAGKVYVWGATGLGTTGIDVADIPEEVQNEKIAWVAAGIDHIVAVGENGKVYAWGANKLGQYGYFDPAVNPNIAPEPDELLNGTIDASNIKKITCGYQATAILMNDGTLYMWGNKNTYQNFDTVATLDGKLTDIDFTLNYVVAVTDGNSVYTGKRGLYDQMRDNMGSATVPLREFLNGRKITSIYATSKTVCALARRRYRRLRRRLRHEQQGHAQAARGRRDRQDRLRHLSLHRADQRGPCVLLGQQHPRPVQGPRRRTGRVRHLRRRVPELRGRFQPRAHGQVGPEGLSLRHG